MKQRLRIFVSSPGDVKASREVAALTIERLVQDYARFFSIEPYLWEYEAMVASGHFQDSIEPPSAFDVVVLILWSRLGTLLPEKTSVREYRGIDGRAPVTGTEWEFEEALQGSLHSGAPDLMVYRKRSPASFDLWDAQRRDQQLQQLANLERFWSQHFANQGVFTGGYTEFDADGEFATALETHLRKLIEKRIARRDPSGEDQSAIVWMHAPYRGLETYEFDDAPIFFGQDEALSTAMVRLTANAEVGAPFLLVLGASGSGKSSLVKAGVVPKLFVPRRITGVAFLRRVVFRPSDMLPHEDLFDALARRLTTEDGPSGGLTELIGPGQLLSSLAAHFRSSTTDPAYPIGTALANLTLAARRNGRMLEHETARLVLVVDQLEELFTSEQLAPADRLRFVGVLVGLVRSGLVWVIATMRSDFWHRAAETPQLMRLAQGDGRLELLLPTPAQLSQMIRRPAAAAGVLFDAHPTTDVPLNEMIAEEVAHAPGALPLLSYLLDQLYRCDVLEARGSALTFASYERLGRLEGAIATKAEAVLDACSPEERLSLKSILFSLVQMSAADGDIERAVSRRVPLSTFPPGSAKRNLVEALLHPDARLLVSDAADSGNPTVRVAHEALITRWAQAREFVQGNAEALKIRGRIEERYTLWRAYQLAALDTTKSIGAPSLFAGLRAWRARLGHEPGLLTEIDLTDGLRLVRDHRSDTESHLIDYIERSAADDKRMRSRSMRVIVAVASVVTVLAILAGAAALIAVRKEHEAQLQTHRTLEAQARSLTEAARGRLKDGDVSGAQSIILEVLTNPEFKQGHIPSAISVFQEARAADKQVLAITGHAGSVLFAAFSPDGQRIVTASYDKTVRIWDAASGQQLLVLSGHTGPVRGVAFSPDGRRIVTASYDKTARIWDVDNGQQLVVLSGHTAYVEGVEFSPDGQRVVTASADNTARIWDVESGQQLLVLSGHTDLVLSAAFSPDGRRILTASEDKTARVWDSASGKQLLVLSGHTSYVPSAAFSPDGRRIVTASWDKTARIWDADSGQQLVVLSGHTDAVHRAAFSPDGRCVVTAALDKTARIWDADSGQQLVVLSGHTDILQSAAFSPDGRRVVTASADKTARIWDAVSHQQLLVLRGHTERIESMGFSPDGRRVVTASIDKSARIWDVNSGNLLLVLNSQTWMHGAAFSPDGRRIVTASRDKTARVWDMDSGQQLLVLSGHTAQVLSARFSPDGRRILTASEDKTARIWDANSGQQLLVLSGGESVSAAFSPDGRRIVTASAMLGAEGSRPGRNNIARIWDAATGQQQLVLSGHMDAVQSAAFSPDGRRVVTASRDKTARVWDAASGSPLLVLIGHTGAVNSVAFSPDGARIVTASEDQTARIWDANSGQQLLVLTGHTGWVMSAEFSPDGQRIVTGSADDTSRIWDARVADLDAQVAWEQAAQFAPLSSTERLQLGLPLDSDVHRWPTGRSKCDQSAGAPYDPLRHSPGVTLDEIVADIAVAACAEDKINSNETARSIYQHGRALIARGDLNAGKRDLERALAAGYRASGVDLGMLLSQPFGGMPDVPKAIALYEQAWADGVTIAAFELGALYEHGVPQVRNSGTFLLAPDEARAWSWYEKGAKSGEPYALARFADKEDHAVLISDRSAERGAHFLKAFSYYASAVERARLEDWPDGIWKDWQTRRASIARLLASEGMMEQVAEAYKNLAPPTESQKLSAKLW